MARPNKFEHRFVICGSMIFYNNILEVHRILTNNKVPAIIPANDDKDYLSISKIEFARYKRRASLKYIKEIRRQETLGIIVINNEKHKIKNYIGGNTFAEIAVAFSHRKKIFLLNETPDFFMDELNAWGTIELKGCLDPVIDYYWSLDVWQPSLFD
jgi:hypothetical protein